MFSDRRPWAALLLAAVLALGACAASEERDVTQGTAPSAGGPGPVVTGSDGQPVVRDGTTIRARTATTRSRRGDGSSSATTAPVAPGATPPTTVPPGLDAELAEAVRITAYDGFVETEPPGPGVGAYDLERASGGDAGERDALEKAGFRRGYGRRWTRSAEDISTYVFELGSAALAEAYLQDTVETALVGNGAATFDVGVAGATGYREQGTDRDGKAYTAWGAVFVRGPRFYEQILHGLRTGGTRSESDSRELCRRQADRVGG